MNNLRNETANNEILVVVLNTFTNVVSPKATGR